MGAIRATANINAFISPIEERIMDNMGDIMDHVVEIFRAEKEAETEEEGTPQPIVKHSETPAALQSLRLYEGQQENAETRLISDLTKHKWVIRGRRMETAVKTQIDWFFKHS